MLFATTRAFNYQDEPFMHHLNFTPFPVLYTNRLLLRQLQPADAQAVFELRTDDAVKRLPLLRKRILLLKTGIKILPIISRFTGQFA